MINYRLTCPQDLTSLELSLWDRLQRGSREFESPYFRAEFTQAVAAVRDDVEVAVIEEDGAAAGFFPFQRRSLNLGKPVAGRLNDFHGVILPRGFRVDARQLIQPPDWRRTISTTSSAINRRSRRSARRWRSRRSSIFPAATRAMWKNAKNRARK